MPFALGIINYNGGTALRSCLDSLLAQKLPLKCIRVWDNSSPDDSARLLQAEYPQIEFLLDQGNLGYGHACNGLAQLCDDEYFAVANMDCIFDPEWSERIWSAAQAQPEVGAWGCLVIEEGNPPTINALTVAMQDDMQPFSPEDGRDPSTAPSHQLESFGVYGAVMLLRTDAYARVGAMDASYFLYYEETDLFWRYQLLQIPVRIEPRAIVRHFRSWSTGRFSLLKLYYSERNRTRSAVKYMPWTWLMRFPFLTVARLSRNRRAGGTYAGQENRMPPAWKIIWTLLKAWTAGLFFGSDWQERKRWSSGVFQSPGLKLLKAHARDA